MVGRSVVLRSSHSLGMLDSKQWSTLPHRSRLTVECATVLQYCWHSLLCLANSANQQWPLWHAAAAVYRRSPSTARSCSAAAAAKSPQLLTPTPCNYKAVPAEPQRARACARVRARVCVRACTCVRAHVCTCSAATVTHQEQPSYGRVRAVAYTDAGECASHEPRSIDRDARPPARPRTRMHAAHATHTLSAHAHAHTVCHRFIDSGFGLRSAHNAGHITKVIGQKQPHLDRTVALWQT